MIPQEIKDLLKTELCNRLPYKLKCMVSVDCREFDDFSGKIIGFEGKAIGELYLVDLNDEHVELYFEGDDAITIEMSNMSIEGLLEIYDCTPYLRPMSSITEDEIKELNKIIEIDFQTEREAIISGDVKKSVSGYNKTNWLNAHHFDYRGLIPKGLALEAPENMYKFD